MSNYTLKQLEGRIQCDECGCKYWERSTQGRARIICADCSREAPRKPDVTKTRVRNDLSYARGIMRLIDAQLKTIDNDDPRVSDDLDDRKMRYLCELANDLCGATATFSEYVSERGGQL
jgi:hypothetical protein